MAQRLHETTKNTRVNFEKQNKLQGADVWAKNNDQTTPLHFACAEGHYEVVQLLVQFAVVCATSRTIHYEVVQVVQLLVQFAGGGDDLGLAPGVKKKKGKKGGQQSESLINSRTQVG